MRYSKHEPDRNVRHTVTFAEEEVKLILHSYAKEKEQGLPLAPTFIWYPRDDSDPRYVKIGVDIVEGKEGHN